MSSSSGASSRERSRVRLRPLRRSDRAPLEALVRATKAFREDEVAVALELVDLGLTPGGGGYRFVVAEGESGEVAGYACWGLTPLTDGVFDLYWIAVEPNVQGRGVGQELLREVERDVAASKGRMVLIETGGTPVYEKTRRFYERAGYREIARVPDFYRVGDDKVVFARRVG